jgi:enamine deaminase RidA (YjgF/YER057c/UK114 family)
MDTAEIKLKELGLTLPAPAAPAGNYVPFVRVGHVVHLSGVLCVADGAVTHAGKVGAEQTVETAYDAAKVCALNALSAVKSAAGSLDAVKRLVYLAGFVNGVEGFAESPAVINGASDLMVAVLGERGRHARAAVTVVGLPKNVTVEIQCVFEVD